MFLLFITTFTPLLMLPLGILARVLKEIIRRKLLFNMAFMTTLGNELKK